MAAIVSLFCLIVHCDVSKYAFLSPSIIIIIIIIILQ